MLQIIAQAIVEQDKLNLPRVGADTYTVQNILSLVFAVVGAIALIVIVFAGLKYVTSQGNPDAVGKAKGTIIYALIGLVIVILAEAIVAFTARSVR